MTGKVAFQPGAAPDPAPAAGPPAQPQVLVAHDGGARAGQVIAVAEDQLAGYLVYDGPQWLGVYQRSSPLRIVKTAEGDAEVWTAIG